MNTQILASGANLTPFLLPSPARVAVLVVPGGGYSNLAMGHEGHDVVAFLNARGYDAYLLQYSTKSTAKAPLYPLPQNEAMEAVRWIRAQNGAHNRAPKLGIWGFSAGGHLAAMTATDPESNLDFAILAYPVISMDSETTHVNSRVNLIGADASAELEQSLCAQNRVSAQTPPTFLFHTANDGAVPAQNSLLFASALAAHGVPFELHIYENGRHGVGLASDDAILSTWGARLEDWLARR